MQFSELIIEDISCVYVQPAFTPLLDPKHKLLEDNLLICIRRERRGYKGWLMQASPPKCGQGLPPTSVFIETPSLGDCHPRLKSSSPAREIYFPLPEVNLVFQRFRGCESAALYCIVQ